MTDGDAGHDEASDSLGDSDDSDEFDPDGGFDFVDGPNGEDATHRPEPTGGSESADVAEPTDDSESAARPPRPDEDERGRPEQGERDGPLADLASSVDSRRERGPTEQDEELFTEERVDEIDADAVWERLDEGEPVIDEHAKADVVRVVEKSAYCERCPHFSTPPEVQCTHDGTEIQALVDSDHFRVANCPKVAENDRLERL